MSNKSESVRVVVRCRPLSSQEKAGGSASVVQLNPGSRNVIISKGTTAVHAEDKSTREFTFDAVFGPESSQESVYEETAKVIVDSVIEGFNGTVFAYGQTGAGKTFTMLGPHTKPAERGLIPRVFEQIFESINRDSLDQKFLIQVSYLEIYNEEIRDLLSGRGGRRESLGGAVASLELHDRPDGSVGVKSLSTVVVKNVEEISALLAQGLRNRSMGSTLMNAESSRSHTLFSIVVESSNASGHVKVGKLNLVDLAGSERQSKTGAAGDTLKEAAKINLSLSALGNVISALVDAGKAGQASFVPYRDSKLTRLLQDSLGGNTKTVMIANIGPSEYNYEESLSTLRYASRAKNIKNKPRVNEDPKDTMIRGFQEEIEKLRSELERRRVDTGPVSLPQHRQSGEREKLMEALKQRDEDNEIHQMKQKELVAKLQDMETKLIQGKEYMQMALSQEEELERTKAALQRREEEELAMRRALEEQKEERQLLEEKFSYQIDQVGELRRKLERVVGKYKRAKNDLSDAESEFRDERETLLATVREMQRVSKLNDLILGKLVGKDELERIEDHCWYDEDKDEWYLDDVDGFECNRRITCVTCQKCNGGAGEVEAEIIDPPAMQFDLAFNEAPVISDRMVDEIVNDAIYFQYTNDGRLERNFHPAGNPIPLPATRSVEIRPSTADRHGRNPRRASTASNCWPTACRPVTSSSSTVEPVPRSRGLVKPNIN